LYRYYTRALVLSILFDTTIYDQTCAPVTYSHMAKMSKNNTFISANYKMGTYTGRLAGTADESFGRMKYFFRADFTSGMQNFPTVFVDWAQFRCTSRCRTSSTGKMSMEEWITGPQYSQDSQPFLALSQVKASRYALAYGPTITSGGGQARQHKQVGFLSLDPERLGANVEDNMTQDFGDNCLNFYLPDKRFKSEDRDSDVEEEGNGDEAPDAEDDHNSDSSSDDDDDEDSDNSDNERAQAQRHDRNEEGPGGGGVVGGDGVVVVGGGGGGDEEELAGADDDDDNDSGGGNGSRCSDITATLFSPSVLRYLQYK
jgi:hypothetical protein